MKLWICTTFVVVICAAFPGLASATGSNTTASLIKRVSDSQENHERTLQSSTCGCSSCTSSVLNRDADGHKVGARIDWLEANRGMSETQACKTVCGTEFPNVCGRECNPDRCGGGGPPPTPTPPSGGTKCNSISPNEYTLPGRFGRSNHCYRIQVRNGGRLLVDTKDPGCARFNAGNRFRGVSVSNYQRTAAGGMAMYQGRWSGSIELLEDPLLSQATFEVQGNSRTKTFSGTLTVPSCGSGPRPTPPVPPPFPVPTPPTGGGGCGCSACTSSVLNRDADGHKVGARIDWLEANRGMSETRACKTVCGTEFPNVCRECDPDRCEGGPVPTPTVPTPPTPTPPTGGGTCGCSSCTSSVLNRDADGHKVGARIDWLEANRGMSETRACKTVCGTEFPNVCRECDPDRCEGGPVPTPTVPTPTVPTPPTGGGRPRANFNEGLNNSLRNQGMLPYLFDNKSRYADRDIYVAVVGITNSGPVWIDLSSSNFQTRPMSSNFNTMQGPSHDVTGWRYANVFTRLSNISSNTIGIPRIAGCKMFISFGSTLYLHFHSTGGYTQPNHENEVDPNRGIRFETIELTWAPNGLWINTSRVDSYNYPMGLEVYGSGVGGNGNYKKVGELKDHNEILNLWSKRVSSPFLPCYHTKFYPGGEAVILQPSKIPQFKENGPSGSYFQPYINEIWNTFRNRSLKASFGDIGIWEGTVSGNVFTMRCVERCPGGAVPGKIAGIPNTQECIEAKGLMHQGGEWDKNVQKMFAAAINRHVIKTNLPSSVTQNWGDRTQYYRSDPHNHYAKFFHGFDITFNSETYAFSYDDVFEQSSTIQANNPEKIRITVGGFYNVAGH